VFGFHEVFHALVIAAGLIFYVAIARVIVTATGTTTKPSKAAAQYSAIATDGNRGLEVLDKLKERDRNDLVAARTDLRDAAATERRFDRSLLTIALPPAIETTARALVRVNESRASLTTEAAASTSLAQLHGYEQQLSVANATVEREVRALRSQLGLPPPETS
jgi:hypothetical protein